jgi:hypothetical protein
MLDRHLAHAELFTRFDTGHFCSTFSPAGFTSAAASLASLSRRAFYLHRLRDLR